MRRRSCVLACLALSIAVLVAGPLLVLAEGSLELTVYFSPTCDHCHLVREQVLSPLLQAYVDRLAVTFIDVSQPEGLGRLEATEARLGSLNNPLPVLVLDDVIIASEDIFEIEEALTSLLQERMGEAGQPTATPMLAPPTRLDGLGATPANAVPIHMAYIEREGCDSCARASLVLQALQEDYPILTITTFSNLSDGDLIEAMGEHLRLPQSRRLIAPSIYVGNDALVDAEITSSRARELIARYSGSGAPAFWEDLYVETGKRSILSRFEAMGPLAVILAALVDGVNPCAFATIIFFVSYLTISRRPRRTLIAIGLAFTGGVFVTYLAVGLGAMSLLRLASTIRVVGSVLYGLMALSCLVLSGLSMHDYFLARQGRLHEMRLNLPDPLRERIKGRIRASSGAFVGAGFVSGLVVSLLELACTGQVYLPTISFVVGIPRMRSYAIAYLALYNLIFVVPLLVILFLSVYGVSASRFQDWFVRNAARAKLIMAILFLLLSLLLLSQAIGT